MANPKFGISYIRYAGFTRLDAFERKRIESIVNLNIEKIKRITPFLGMRLHLKPLHEKATEVARQGHIHQIDGFLRTNKGRFNAVASHRNPYNAVADILENLLSQVKHKHPHKEEWKEAFKKSRQRRWRKKKT